jgi:hypothetical protein
LHVWPQGVTERVYDPAGWRQTPARRGVPSALPHAASPLGTVCGGDTPDHTLAILSILD